MMRSRATRKPPGMRWLVFALVLAGCSGGGEIIPDKKVPGERDPKSCLPSDYEGRIKPFLIDEASGTLRQDLEAVLKTRGVAVVATSCDRGVELLEACEVEGSYSFVGLSTKDKTLVMKDEAKAAANLGFGLGQGLSAAFSAGRELVLQYRLVGKYKTTVPGVVRGQLSSANCNGATHFVTSVDVGAFSSFTASRGAFSASANFAGQGGSAEGSTEKTDKNTAGDFEACGAPPAEDQKDPQAPQNCSASLRVSLAPIIEADSPAVLSKSRRIQKDKDCRVGFVLNNDEMCVPRSEAEVYQCEPTNFEECRQMCIDPDVKDYNKQSCGRMANLLMQHIMEAYEDTAQADTKKTSRLEILEGIVDEDANPFVYEAVNDYGPRLTEVCEAEADGNTCALATIYKLINIEETMEKAVEGLDETQTQQKLIEMLTEIYKLIQRGCRAGEQFSCEVMEIMLYEDPDAWAPAREAMGVEDINKEYLEVVGSSCDNGNGLSCFALSRAYSMGERTEKDLEKAASLAERSCHGGLSEGCFVTASIRMKHGGLCQRAMAIHRSSAGEEGEDGGSLSLDKDFSASICGEAGKPFDRESNDWSLDDFMESFESFRTGCSFGDTIACKLSAQLYELVIDRQTDECPDEPEDRDGFEDGDGCPDPDNDQDGIPDGEDKCPDDAENINGRSDEDGCPELALGDGEIILNEQIFFARNKDKILAKSDALIADVATILKENPTIRVRIEGHTDDVGNATKNKALSLARAESVREALIGQGVAADRLEAVGYGSERPKVEIKKKMRRRDLVDARAKNRRVEFNFVN